MRPLDSDLRAQPRVELAFGRLPAYPPAVWLFSMELIIDVKSVFN